MLRARTGWTRARQARVWTAMAAAALAVGCSGGDGTGTRLRARVTRLGALMRAGHGHDWARALTRARQWGPEAV